MYATDLKTLIESAVPVSPDRKYALAWSWRGSIGILTLNDWETLLTFREERGAILRAGFSPDMRQLVAENEDRSFSVWYMAREMRGQRFAEAGNIVEFMLNNDLVPCLNVTPGVKAYRYELELREFSCAQLDYYDWENIRCRCCAWCRVDRSPKPWTQHTLTCALGQGCEFKPKGV